MPRKKTIKSQVDPTEEKKKVEQRKEAAAKKKAEEKAKAAEEKALEAKEKVKDIEKEKTPKKVEKKIIEKKRAPQFLLFDKWKTYDIVVEDPGLKPYLNLQGVLVPFSAGRHVGKQFWKSKKHIVERLMDKLFVSGHKGKKHYRTSGLNTGKYSLTYKIVKDAFTIVENRTKKNPIEVFVRAIEKGSPREGVATIEYGGVRYPKATDLAPQRRIDLALRWMTQGAFQASSSAKTKLNIQKALANEIIAAAEGEQQKSNCLNKKFELERQAAASR
jgi:small subunit ribosomal protein S7